MSNIYIPDLWIEKHSQLNGMVQVSNWHKPDSGGQRVERWPVEEHYSPVPLVIVIRSHMYYTWIDRQIQLCAVITTLSRLGSYVLLDWGNHQDMNSSERKCVINQGPDISFHSYDSTQHAAATLG